MSVQDAEDQQGRVGPFVTYLERVRPDGVVARWESRDHRKHLKAGLGRRLDVVGTRARGWWIAVLFAIGSLLFALGAVPGYASAAGASWDAVTFFTGSVFFTAAGFLTYREAVDAARGRRAPLIGISSSTSPTGLTGGPPSCSWPGPCSSTSAPGSPSAPTYPRRPRTSTCGDLTRSGRSASWSRARSPGSTPPPQAAGSPDPGPGGSAR